MDVAEFRRLGYLQELNRRFLHPLGLALSVTVDTETGAERFEGVLDARDDPEGMFFGDGADASKAAFIDAERARRMPPRVRALGYWVQPALSVEKALGGEGGESG